MPVTLSRHKQWTPIDLSDIGKSGYAKGTSKHKGRQMGMDVLTGRRMDPELQGAWDRFEQRFQGVNYGTGGREFRQKIARQRELEGQTLRAGYTLADIGKEQYVGGGQAGWGHWLPRVENMGWAYDAELGTWKHSSWGDEVSWGDYVDQDYGAYLEGLPAAGPGMLETGSEGYTGGEADAAATGGVPAPTAGGPVFGGAPPAAPPGGAVPQTFTPPAAGTSFAGGGAPAPSRPAPSGGPAPVPDAWASSGAPGGTGGGGGGAGGVSPSAKPGGGTNLFSQPQFFGGGRSGGKGWQGGGSWVGSDRDIKDLGLEPPKFSDYRR
jgi:hypothetical protein